VIGGAGDLYERNERPASATVLYLNVKSHYDYFIGSSDPRSSATMPVSRMW